ncbi:MAG: hypothetical protein ACREAY_02965 [Nitrososphaera sp.]|uniref:hypothetical protein n=1 Tax=Nitrososphaera sp. TaxID=1971748 RepID=UPI003D6E1C83
MLRYYVAFAVAIVSDLLDYTAMGSLPVIGDVIDAITIPILYALIGKFSLFGAVEFIPFADLVPTYTIAVALAYRKELKKGEQELDGQKRTSTPL